MATGKIGKEIKGQLSSPVENQAHQYKSIFSKKNINKLSASKNTFCLGDNLYLMKKYLNEGKKVDLIYTDPPYGTNKEFIDRDLVHSYSDRRNPDDQYEFLKERIVLMRDLLNDDGSIYLHIGSELLGECKIILDEVFGKSNLRNVITRRKCSSKNSTKNSFPDLNDYILFYSKTSSYKFFQQGISPTDEWINKEYPKKDEKGRYKLVPVHAPGIRHGETGKKWKGKLPPKGKHWQLVPNKLEMLDKEGEIHWSKNNNPRRKVRLTKDKTLPFTNYWSNFRDPHHQSIKITGYPTEKNIDMLKLIVKSSSVEGDTLLDPFCGSGTFLEASASLNRHFIGFDNSPIAAEHTLKRLKFGTSNMGDHVNKTKQEKFNFVSNIDFEFLIPTGSNKDFN